MLCFQNSVYTWFNLLRSWLFKVFCQEFNFWPFASVTFENISTIWMFSHITLKTWIVRIVKTCTEERYRFRKQKEAIWEWDLTLSVGRSEGLLKIQRRQIFRNLSWFRVLLYAPDVCPRVSLNMILHKSYRAFAPYLYLYLYMCLWMYLHLQLLLYLYLFLYLQAPRA